jgi:integrase/recombinase XerD
VRIPEGSRLQRHLEAFVADLRARRYSESSVNVAQRIMPRFFVFLARKRVTDLRAVTLSHLQGFSAQLARAKTAKGDLLSLSTRQSYLAAIRGFFGFLERSGVVLQNAAQSLELPSVSRLPRDVISVDQAARLMNAPSAHTKMGQRDRAVLELFYGTGIRRGEAERLDVTDVDLAQGRLIIRNGKGRKDRVVPLAGRAAAALDLYLREVRPLLAGEHTETALFLCVKGKRLADYMLMLCIRKYARKAGIGIPVSAHSLRHACATHLVKGGADVRHVQEILGHKKLDTTEIYTRVAINDLKEVIARSHPRRPAPK